MIFETFSESHIQAFHAHLRVSVFKVFALRCSSRAVAHTASLPHRSLPARLISTCRPASVIPGTARQPNLYLKPGHVLAVIFGNARQPHKS